MPWYWRDAFPFGTQRISVRAENVNAFLQKVLAPVSPRRDSTGLYNQGGGESKQGGEKKTAPLAGSGRRSRSGVRLVGEGFPCILREAVAKPEAEEDGEGEERDAADGLRDARGAGVRGNGGEGPSDCVADANVHGVPFGLGLGLATPIVYRFGLKMSTEKCEPFAACPASLDYIKSRSRRPVKQGINPDGIKSKAPAARARAWSVFRYVPRSLGLILRYGAV